MSRLLAPENFIAEKLAWHQRISGDPTISLSAKAVAGFILHDLNAAEGGAWRGQESMAKNLGVSDRQLRRLLEELATACYLQIEVRKGRGRTNIYRATRPADQAEVAQKRTSTADQTTQNRTHTADQTPKNRTFMTRKQDTGVRQYLYEPNRRSTPPEVRPDSGKGALAVGDLFPQAGIRTTVSRLVGEGATISYLDPAVWDADGQRIVCRSAIGYARLRDLVGRRLADEGVSIAFQPRETGQMAA